MKKQIILLLSLYGFWIAMFVVQKPLFMLFNHVEGATFSDWINVITHGFILDFCFSAYFLFIPITLLMINNFTPFNIRRFLYIYNLILGIIITIIFAVDCVLYSYWGFRIDATLIFYLRDFTDSLNSVTLKDLLLFLLISVIYFLVFFVTYKHTINKLIIKNVNSQKKIATITLIIFIPVLVICSRGGFSTATANVGMVYYCDNQKLNISAVNPSFNLMYSLSKTEDFAKKYFFYDNNLCNSEFNKLITETNVPENELDSTITNFKIPRNTNVLLIILESFSANTVKELNNKYGVINNHEITPTLNSMAENSIFFDNAYSNGMRTDRGVVSITTGFLAQPDMTIIKYPEKTRTLPSMAKTLANAGYNTEMIYGGDINFANMRSFFYGSSYKNVIDYKSFPAKDRMSKWGVKDEIIFSYLYDRIKQYDKTKPFFTTLLTLSSHEPFDVGTNKFENKYVNSVYYADSCLGVFLNKFKTTAIWNNTLIILVADHAYSYPKTMAKEDSALYRIPIIFTGGVIKDPYRIKRFVNQTDIPKTVFSAMNLPCEEFTYSRNVFNPYTKNYAFFVYTNGFGFIDSTGLTVWDRDANKVIWNPDNQREMKGKVLLQTLYNDISKR